MSQDEKCAHVTLINRLVLRRRACHSSLPLTFVLLLSLSFLCLGNLSLLTNSWRIVAPQATYRARHTGLVPLRPFCVLLRLLRLLLPFAFCSIYWQSQLLPLPRSLTLIELPCRLILIYPLPPPSFLSTISLPVPADPYRLVSHLASCLGNLWRNARSQIVAIHCQLIYSCDPLGHFGHPFGYFRHLTHYTSPPLPLPPSLTPSLPFLPCCIRANYCGRPLQAALPVVRTLENVQPHTHTHTSLHSTTYTPTHTPTHTHTHAHT